MSFTETQVLHSLSQSPSRSSVMGSYILAKNGVEVLDNKLGDAIKPINVHPTHQPSSPSRTRVTSQCSFSTIWLIRTLSYFQTTHLAFVSLINTMNEMMQKKVAHILPLFLYMSLLLLATQAVVIMMLLAQSLLPLGIFFLFGCVCSMGFIFCSTAVITEFDKPYLDRRKAHLQ